MKAKELWISRIYSRMSITTVLEFISFRFDFKISIIVLI